jgi:hypothetical protein
VKTNQVGTTREEAAMIEAYEEKIKAQIQEAKAKLDLLEATVRQKKAEAEITALGGLKATRENIERKLQDLRATSSANVSRAKAAIEADVTRFKAAIEDLAAKVKPRTGAK